jgi:ATP-dependent RNA helicase RhlE
MSFERFHLHPDVLQGIRDMRYEVPTPIQEQAIPPVLEGRCVIGNAQTGTGKTAAFLLPLIHRMMQKPAGKTRVLVLVPTRELACQIDDNCVGLAYHTPVKSAAVYGGVEMTLQERALKGGTTIIVATPGRLLDHHRYGNWRFEELEVLVLDEADRMLDMGFLPDIQAIIAKIPPPKQVLFFSATMPQPVVDLAKTLMKHAEPVHIRVGEPRPPSAISQYFYPVPSHQKEDLLVRILRNEEMRSVIVFSRTKLGADRLGRLLGRAGFRAGVIHGGREQEHRDEVLNKFKTGILQVLVATDVAARGIDIEGVSHVVNVEVPDDPDVYVHRIGRTARAEAVGDAFTLLAPEEEEYARDVERRVGKEIPRVRLEGFPYGAAAPARPHGHGRPGHGPGRGHRPWERRHGPGGPHRHGGHGRGHGHGGRHNPAPGQRH